MGGAFGGTILGFSVSGTLNGVTGASPSSRGGMGAGTVTDGSGTGVRGGGAGLSARGGAGGALAFIMALTCAISRWLSSTFPAMVRMRSWISLMRCASRTRSTLMPSNISDQPKEKTLLRSFPPG